MTTSTHPLARTPEELADLWIERAAAQDLDGLVALYAPDAVMLLGDGPPAVGHDAIRAVHAPLVAEPARFPLGRRLPTLVCADIALCGSTVDGRGRSQVARRQRDSSWLRILDRPNP
jgi:ketosteroid isomerase-like protein